MAMARPVSRLELTASERQELERRVKAPSASKRDSLRAAIVLRRSEGIKQVQVTSSPISKTFKVSTDPHFEEKFWL